MGLPHISALITLFAVSMYVLLDGFDLGVGALLLLTRDEADRDRMVNALAPTWDGNETWLILAGVALLAAFPIAYGILLPAFYLPLIVMLMALGCRGVSFEFRSQPNSWRRLWNRAFAGGSIIAALCQGIVLGGLILGVNVKDQAFAGGVLDILNPYCLLTGVTVLLGYTVLGAAWLVYKATLALQGFAVTSLRIALGAFAVFAVLTWAGAAMVQPGVGALWESSGNWLMILSGIFLLALILSGWSAGRWSDGWPFAFVTLAFLAALSTTAVTFWPNIVPFRLSIEQAASPTQSHVFLLVGASIVMPVVLGYSFFAYRAFRGKVPDYGYET